MGSLTVTTPYARSGRSIVRASAAGDLWLMPFTFAFSTAYATGGDTIPAGSLPTGFKDLISVVATNAPGGFGLHLDVANSKMLIYTPSATGAVQVTNGTNLQTILGSGAYTVYFYVR
jgi:hypothetical protein